MMKKKSLNMKIRLRIRLYKPNSKVNLSQQCKASNMFFLLQARSVCNPSCCHYNPSYNVIYCFQEIKLPL